MPKGCHLEGDPGQTVVQPEVQSPHPDVGQAAQAGAAVPDPSAPRAALAGPLCRGIAAQQPLEGRGLLHRSQQGRKPEGAQGPP